MRLRKEKRHLQPVSTQDPQSVQRSAGSTRRSSRTKRDGKISSFANKKSVIATELKSKRARSKRNSGKETQQSEPTQVLGVAQFETEIAASRESAPDQMISIPELTGDDASGEPMTAEPAIHAASAANSEGAENPGNDLVSVNMAEHTEPLCEGNALAEPAHEVQPLIESQPASSPANRLALFCAKMWDWSRRHIKVRRTKKRLRVCESVSLGEKRFIAVIQIDGEEFLVGGAPNSVSTLARLERPQEFSDLLKQPWAGDPAKA
jgi:hypothetical protein